MQNYEDRFKPSKAGLEASADRESVVYIPVSASAALKNGLWFVKTVFIPSEAET